jgi:hypothetical protein
MAARLERTGTDLISSMSRARGLADTIGNKLAALEAMLAEQSPPRPLH